MTRGGAFIPGSRLSMAEYKGSTMQHEQLPQMLAGLKTTAAGGALTGSSWLLDYNTEIESIAAIVGMVCMVAGTAYTIFKSRNK
jgi:hypothetical protein